MYINVAQEERHFVHWESKARVICHSTPKFARQIGSKYGRMTSYQVEKDLEENHGRQISRNRIQQISEKVSSIIEQKESEWSYAPS